MAAIHDLLAQVQDEALRARLEQEINKLSKTKKFGLVFEEHLPECTPLYDIPVKRGSTVAKKTGAISEMYEVNSIRDGVATCYHKVTEKMEEIPVEELVCVAQFGEPIYPYLKPIDSVCNAPDSDLWHTLIEADNYHALQLLEYLYAGKVDCIYIDPPYNTGARDWKYNNDYVDSNDSYRHSKWLSFMERRLALAKRLLNPSTGTLIVTIDEHEVHHLRTLLEQVFQEAYIQMATIVINQKGVSQDRLARVEEYAIFVFMKNSFLPVQYDDLLSLENSIVTQEKPRWERLLRGGTDSRREDSPTLFYPVYVDPETKRITGVGDVLPLGIEPDLSNLDSKTVAWPIRKDGSLGRWQVSPPSFMELVNKGFAKLGTFDKKRKTWTVLYLNRGTRKRIDEGDIVITGRDPITGAVNVEFTKIEARLRNIKTVWHRKLHDSGVYGSTLLRTLIGRDVKFDFPKSLYSTKDAINAVVLNKPNALCLDFFAGSGTTLNAINLLNAEDGGHRRCILVTNNEVSDDDEKALISEGYQPGDEEWEKRGVCKSVTWNRTKSSILGKREDGTVIEGEYYTSQTKSVEVDRDIIQVGFVNNVDDLTLPQKKQLVKMLTNGELPQNLVKADSKFVLSENTKHKISILLDPSYADEWIEAASEYNHLTTFYVVSDNRAFAQIKEQLTEVFGRIVVQQPVKRQMSEGFKANVNYFKLSFLDKTSVALGRQLKELIPVLWLKAGAYGLCPVLEDDNEFMMICPNNRFAILINDKHFKDFDEEIQKYPEIKTIYVVTDSEPGYREMISDYGDKDTYQLYRDYLDNFRINTGR